MPARQLSVAQEALEKASRRIAKAIGQKRLRSGDVVIRFQSDHLALETPGCTEEVPASGAWPGALRVSGALVVMFSRGEPPGTTIELTYDSGFLHVVSGKAHLRLKATWQDISHPRIDIPLNATDRHYLQLTCRFPSATIKSSGLDKHVAKAEERLSTNIDRAFTILAEYGVQRSELDSMVRTALAATK